MNTFTRTIPAAELATFRRRVLRTGGAIVSSVFCPYGTSLSGGYRVTYVAQVGA